MPNGTLRASWQLEPHEGKLSFAIADPEDYAETVPSAYLRRTPGCLLLCDGLFAQPIETGVHSWNPCFICYGHAYERSQHLFRSACCAIHYPAGLRDAQAETTDGRVQITKDVSVLRLDHVSIKDILLGVWQISLTAVK
jgi:hypothetical protein